jgi:hypothetical protein
LREEKSELDNLLEEKKGKARVEGKRRTESKRHFRDTERGRKLKGNQSFDIDAEKH